MHLANPVYANPLAVIFSGGLMLGAIFMATDYVTDPVGYFVCEKDPEGFERFEATFPKKEKRKLTGQLF